MSRIQKSFMILKVLVLLAFSLGSLPTATQAADASQSSPVQKDWQKVENSKVCMVTDMVFPRDQIPVKVSGKTYYGCCENCKERLGKDEAVRFAIDPISKKKVDKAKAVIAAGPDGSVVYFENDANFKKFLSFN